MQKIYKLGLVLAIILSAPIYSRALEAVGSDARIRTFIYGENDVFKVSTTYGYQTVIELDPKEKIQTISIGNPNIFKIIPSGTRLFIKTMENDQTTNMTVITDKRSYQFELTSALQDPQDMMYVVKFAFTDYMDNGTSGQQQAERPMDLYSPMNLSNIQPAASAAGGAAIPTPKDMIDNNMPTAPGTDTPLSIQYKNNMPSAPGSPNVNVPAVKLPFSMNQINKNEIA